MKKEIQSLNYQPGKVTIVLINYNHFSFLEESISSIFNQIQLADKIIIIDDASIDESRSKISSMICQKPNVEFVEHSENMGCVKALNHGLSRTTTEYVMFLGADDRLEVDYIKECLFIMNSSPLAAFCCSASNILDASSNIIGYRPVFFPSNKPSYLAPKIVKRQLTKFDNFFLGQTAMYRTKFLLSLGGFNSTLGSFADGMAMRHLALEYGFCFLPFTLSSWRFLGSNMSITNITKIEYLEDLIDSSAKYISDQKKGLFPEKYVNYLERRLRFGSARLKILMSDNIDEYFMRDLAKILNVDLRELSIFRFISRFSLRVKKRILILYTVIICAPFSLLSILNLILKRRLRTGLE